MVIQKFFSFVQSIVVFLHCQQTEHYPEPQPAAFMRLLCLVNPHYCMPISVTCILLWRIPDSLQMH